MNELTYYDYPSTLPLVVMNELDAQSGCEDVYFLNKNLPVGYEDWNAFDGEGFDFDKPIYQSNVGDKIAQTTVVTANSNGEWDLPRDEPYLVCNMVGSFYPSGGGFMLKTYMDTYHVVIELHDKDGIRTKEFDKSATTHADEFFPFAYDELDTVSFRFTRSDPNRFFRIVAIGLGGVRKIDNSLYTENPVIESNFALMSDELSLDTLEFTVFAGEDDFFFIAGEKIVVSETGKEFYINTATLNSNKTITVNCYDSLGTRDRSFSGVMRTDTAVKSTAFMDILFGDLDYEFDASTSGFDGLTFRGTISDDVTCREAIRMYLQGCTLALKRIGNRFVVVSPFNTASAIAFFDVHNIVKIDYEALEKYTRVHFSRHNYTADKTNGLQEAYRDYVDTGSVQELSFGEPYNSVSVWYVASSQGGQETLERVDSNRFHISQTGAYFMKATNDNYAQEIVVRGYPYKVSYSSIDYIPPSAAQFKENELMISDCTLSVNISKAAYIRRLEFYQQFDKVIKIKSIANYNAGDKCNITLDGKAYEGFIESKRDEMTGVYEYTIYGYEIDI